ncbi:hypothetical protein NBRC116598_38260 [Pseudophaeobacter arcticus]|jgi:hypothetical protein|uniref:Uncharacterized protein n=1 Tax=Pseudophaeobacter arcticus TaxID=385492 RepID=A0ABQ0AR75_9RHOB
MKKSQQRLTLTARGYGRTLDVQGDRRSVLLVAGMYYFNRLILLLAGCGITYILGEPIAGLSDLVRASFGK